MTASTVARPAGMRPSAQRFGLSVALVTPFDRHGDVDLARLSAHARRCL
ncbi:MAG: hypothetical protein IT519_12870, partial [Burkholderiales bacterium]|nr:hypothetical protein [Burkholderiales bacterium]